MIIERGLGESTLVVPVPSNRGICRACYIQEDSDEIDREERIMEFKKVIVAGAGKSGIASTELLLRHGAEIVMFDQKADLDTSKLDERFGGKVAFELGELSDKTISESDLFVISPGIPTDADFVKKVEAAGVPIMGEIELGYYFGKGKIAAITGTNGKTTTTALVGEIFKAYSKDYVVAGNIGYPLTEYSDTTTDETLISLEVSSFQLETISTFRPHVSAVLNLTPDHLNRHYTLDNYYNAKLRIAENQDMSDYMVANYDDPETRERVAAAIKNTNIVWFSRKEELENGVFVSDGSIRLKDKDTDVIILDLSDIKILGTHNVENVLAATAIAYYMGIPAEVIKKTVSEFNGVEHRIQFVRELNGVKFYNDSKGTNPDAAIKAIEAMKGQTVLIGGGYDKKSTYDEWVELFPGRVRKLVLIGATADDIEKCAREHGFTDIARAATLKEAVEYSYSVAESGDNVLLSPACASWDMFKSFEERGTLFVEYVNGLEG